VFFTTQGQKQNYVARYSLPLTGAERIKMRLYAFLSFVAVLVVPAAAVPVFGATAFVSIYRTPQRATFAGIYELIRLAGIEPAKNPPRAQKLI
jgi:hypothetical protein